MKIIPFLTNPLHKRRRAKKAVKKVMAKRRRKSVRKVRRHVARRAVSRVRRVVRRRARRSPGRRFSRVNPVGLMLANPVLPKHRLTLFGNRISKKSKIAHRMRGKIVNPISIIKGALPSKGLIMEAVGVSVGLIAVQVLPKYIVPVEWRTGTKGIVTKVGTTLALGMIVGKVLKKKQLANAVVLGGIASVMLDVANIVLPKVGIQMGAIIPSAVPALRTPASIPAMRNRRMGMIIPEQPVMGLSGGNERY